MKFLQDHEKAENPPNAPMIRPIENYWAILKMHAYEGNWTTKSRESMIRRIKKKQQEINQDIVIKMLENLKMMPIRMAYQAF